VKRSEYWSALTPLDRAAYRRWALYIVPFYAALAGGLWALSIATKSESSPPSTASAASTTNDHRTVPIISGGFKAAASRN
jgi:hypothetical protein